MNPMAYCRSCAAPLTQDLAGSREHFCKYCTDERGNVKPKEEVRAGIAAWLRSWQPEPPYSQPGTRAVSKR
jgi:hypothetical protein